MASTQQAEAAAVKKKPNGKNGFMDETEDKNVEVQFSVDEQMKIITLPKDMDCQEAIKWLQRKDEEMNRKVSVSESIDAYPLDGALALHKAMSQKYGWNNLIPTPGFFGDRPPLMISVQTGSRAGDFVQVPWGRMEIPGVDGFIETNLTFSEGRPKFVIGGTVKRKHEKEVSELAKLARDIVARESIYRGKALRMKFVKDPRQVEDINDFNPKFMDLSQVKEDELIFPADVADMVRTNLFTPIENTELCRKHRIPLKRGILLAGPYGVGKTLTAYVSAKKCVDSKWTFIYLETVEQLQQAIHFAKQYAPAMVFAEDIDQVVRSDQRRDEAINSILNTIDGVDTKNNEIIVTLTTNHVDQISQAMLRPGRLDAVISIPPPDAAAAQRLVRLYARDLLSPSENLDEVGTELNGHIPAVIREVVERSKLGAISHTEPGKPLSVNARDLVVAAKSMTQHLKLLEPKAEDMRSDVEKAAATQADGIIRAATLLAHKVAETGMSNGAHASQVSA